MNRSAFIRLLFLIIYSVALTSNAAAQSAKPQRTVDKVLFIGDSMTGWMAERLNAYGEENGFDVATVVWDGSTIKKWAAAATRLEAIIDYTKPDAIFISLGINELFDNHPDLSLSKSLNKLEEVFGNRPFLWIGPPSWPGHQNSATLDKWLSDELGHSRYFSSINLSLPRQSRKNPHPTRDGIIKWIDSVIEWIPNNAAVKFKSLNPPADSDMSRGKTFIYKRMNENL